MDEEKLIHELTSDEKLAAWGNGEWVEEPEYLEFTYKGYLGIVKRVYHYWNPGKIELGHLCGYVQIPEGHPWHGKDHDDIDADCHGGLTWSGANDAGLYLVGFDCGHSMDICPGTEKFMIQSKEELAKRFPWLSPATSKLFVGAYKNLEFVKRQLIKLVDQAIKAQEAS